MPESDTDQESATSSERDDHESEQELDGESQNGGRVSSWDDSAKTMTKKRKRSESPRKTENVKKAKDVDHLNESINQIQLGVVVGDLRFVNPNWSGQRTILPAKIKKLTESMVKGIRRVQRSDRLLLGITKAELESAIQFSAKRFGLPAEKLRQSIEAEQSESNTNFKVIPRLVFQEQDINRRQEDQEVSVEDLTRYPPLYTGRHRRNALLELAKTAEDYDAQFERAGRLYKGSQEQKEKILTNYCWTFILVDQDKINRDQRLKSLLTTNRPDPFMGASETDVVVAIAAEMFNRDPKEWRDQMSSAQSLTDYAWDVYRYKFSGAQCARLLRLTRDPAMVTKLQDVFESKWSRPVFSLSWVDELLECKLDNFLSRFLRSRFDVMRSIFGKQAYRTVRPEDLTVIKGLRDQEGKLSPDLGLQAFFPADFDDGLMPPIVEATLPLGEAFLTEITRRPLHLSDDVQLPAHDRGYRHPKLLPELTDDDFVLAYNHLLSERQLEMMDEAVLKSLANFDLPLMSAILKFLYYLVEPSFVKPSNNSSKYRRLDYGTLFSDAIWPRRGYYEGVMDDANLLAELKSHNRERPRKLDTYFAELYELVRAHGKKERKSINPRQSYVVKASWREPVLGESALAAICTMMREDVLLKEAIVLTIQTFGTARFKGIGVVLKKCTPEDPEAWFNLKDEVGLIERSWRLVDSLQKLIYPGIAPQSVRKEMATQNAVMCQLILFGIEYEIAARTIWKAAQNMGAQKSNGQDLNTQTDVMKAELDEQKMNEYKTCIETVKESTEALAQLGYTVAEDTVAKIQALRTADDLEKVLQQLPHKNIVNGEARALERPEWGSILFRDYKPADVQIGTAPPSTAKNRRQKRRR